MSHYFTRIGWVLLLACLLQHALAQDYSIHFQNTEVQFSEIIFPSALPESDSVLASATFQGNYYLIIQFEDLPSPERILYLESQGIYLIDYIPHYAYLAKIGHDTNLDQAGIRAYYPYKGNYKIPRRLFQTLFPGNFPGLFLEIRAHTWPGIDLFELQESLESLGFIANIPSNGYLTVQVAPERISDLASHPAIRRLDLGEPEPEAEGIKGRTSSRLNALSPSAGLGFDGAGVFMAIADDGTVNHRDYSGRVINHTSVNYGNHGDMTVGMAIGDGIINPLAAGMAPGARLHLYYISSYPHITNAQNNYNQLGVIVTSTSYGEGCGGFYSDSAVEIDDQVKKQPQLLHVFSAGNNSSSNCSPTYGTIPAGGGTYFGNLTGGRKAAKNVLAVGNLYYDDSRVSSSSRGPAEDGRIKPDLCAMGQNDLTTDENDTYRLSSGTSSASPVIAGVAASLIQAYRSFNNGNNPSSALLKASLLNGAEDLGRPGPDYEFGWGRVNGARSLEILEHYQHFSASINHNGLNQHSIQIPAGTKAAKIMLYWIDPPGSPVAQKALVNDLDLSLQTSSGVLYHPLVLSHFPHLDSLIKPAYRGIDRVNNMEQIVWENPTPGTHTIKVGGFMVPQSPQSYVVVYHFISDQLELSYPMGNESFVPGETEVIRWDAYDDNGFFSLSYSVNGGSSWTTIASTIGAEVRHFEWQVPDVMSGQAKIRISRQGQTASSANFSILKVPEFQVYTIPGNKRRIEWEPVAGANAYDVFAVENDAMTIVASTSNTLMDLNGTPNQGKWFSVRARNTSGITGRRAIAQYHELTNCTTSFNLSFQFDGSPAQTSWHITNSANQIVAAGGPYSSQASFSQLDVPICLPEGCYFLSVFDSGNNGLCCQNGNGAFELTNSNGVTLFEGSQFGASTAGNFCATPGTQPLALSVVSQQAVSCFGGQNGAATVNASGGSGNYSYLWSNGLSGASVTGLSAGTYQVTVNDGTALAFTTVSISQPNALLLQTNATNTTCGGQSNGTAQAIVSGGVPPYQYFWSNGAMTANLTNLQAGYYGITITDAGGCSKNSFVEVNSSSLMELYVFNTAQTCSNGSDGSVSAYIIGGSAPYTYLWNNGATASYQTGLSAGNYSVTITDATGCSVLGQTTIPNLAPLQINLNITQPTCLNTNTGSVIAATSGGVAPYTYAWNTGATGSQLNALPTGTYQVTVTDANGCSKSTSFNINAPQGITLNLSPQSAGCAGQTNGYILSNVSGGTGNYSYLWNTGATSPNLFNLPAGLYSLTVSDAGGCQTSNYAQISSNSSIQLTSNLGSPSCAGGSDGYVYVAATGGTPPYTYQWSNGSQNTFLQNIPAGWYYITVSDHAGCSYSQGIQLAAPPLLQGNIQVVNALNGTGGSLQATVSGGTPPYSYLWNTGATTAQINQLAPGNYQVQIKDARNCELALQATVMDEVTANDCQSTGINTGFEWIQSVRIGDFYHQSNNNGGYAFFNNLSTLSAISGDILPVELVPGFLSNAYNENWRIWIDFNQNGDLSDPGEEVMPNVISNQSVSAAINIPSGIAPGEYLLRVSMKYGSPAQACEVFAYGEVEDYLINIGTTSQTYCAASGNSTSNEWIQKVSFGSVTHSSGNNGGYANFSNISFQTTAGSLLPFTMTPGYRASPIPESWAIWIDWNLDGDFEDATEQVFLDQNVGGEVTGSIAVPEQINAGTRRMRVLMKWGNISGPCGNFPWGEVEDYSLYVDVSSNQPLAENTSSSVRELAIKGVSKQIDSATTPSAPACFPNPASTYINLKDAAYYPQGYKVQLINSSGISVWEENTMESSADLSLTIPVSHLPNGLYWVSVIGTEMRWTKKVMINH
ncbi:MAG TPA: GEVED domain-containing protein [Saprospiraceae bacterium]|nr:GEVED domain-containing protein [Saprospiraceae bacterium]HMQ84585.1 GEVED domain-containing protein [Saprospiraceae bacterium]